MKQSEEEKTKLNQQKEDMKKQKKEGNGGLRQSIIPDPEQRSEPDEQYGHLVKHLIDQDGKPDDKSQWTSVFSRDMPTGLEVRFKQLGLS